MPRLRGNNSADDPECWLVEQLKDLDLNKSRECTDIAVFTIISEGNRDYARDGEVILVVTDSVVQIMMALSEEQFVEITNSLIEHLNDDKTNNPSLVDHCILLKQFRIVARTPKNKPGRTELVLVSEAVEYLETYPESQSDQQEFTWYDEVKYILNWMKKYRLPVSKRIKVAPTFRSSLNEASTSKSVESCDEGRNIDSDTTRVTNSTQQKLPSMFEGASTSKNVCSEVERRTPDLNTIWNWKSKKRSRDLDFVTESVKMPRKESSSSQEASTSKNVDIEDELIKDLDASCDSNYEGIPRCSGSSFDGKDYPVIIQVSSLANGEGYFLVNGEEQYMSPKSRLWTEPNSPVIESKGSHDGCSKETGTQASATSVSSQGFDLTMNGRSNTKERSSSNKKRSEDTILTSCRKVMTYMKHKKRLVFSSQTAGELIENFHRSEFRKNKESNRQTTTNAVTSNSTELISDEPETRPSVFRPNTSSLLSSAQLVKSTSVTVSESNKVMEYDREIVVQNANDGSELPKINSITERVNEPLRFDVVNGGEKVESRRIISASTQTSLHSDINDQERVKSRLISVITQTDEASCCHFCPLKAKVVEECSVSTSSSTTGMKILPTTNETVTNRPSELRFNLNTRGNSNNLCEKCQHSETQTYAKLRKKNESNVFFHVELSEERKTKLCNFVRTVQDEITLKE